MKHYIPDAIIIAAGLGLLILGSGCSTVDSQTPKTHLKWNGFELAGAKNTVMKGVHFSFETNGFVRLDIEEYTSINDPEVVKATGLSGSQLISSGSSAFNSGIGSVGGLLGDAVAAYAHASGVPSIPAPTVSTNAP